MNFHLKDDLIRNGIYSLLRRTDARENTKEKFILFDTYRMLAAYAIKKTMTILSCAQKLTRELANLLCHTWPI